MARIAVIGVGNQGRYHCKAIQALTELQLSLVVDKNVERSREAAAEFKVPCADSYAGRVSEFDAAIIAVPTSAHFAIAADLARQGKHVLIEKPVTATIEEAEELDSIAKTTGIVAHVGFPERFNPAVLRALPALTKPLFIESHRLGVFSPRSLDIDVVLDLMIHDLDLLYLFLKEEPSTVEAVGIPVLSRNIDIANARLKFPGKCVVNMTASRVSAQKMRKMRLFQPYSYLSLDFSDQSFSQYSLEPDLCNAGFPEIRRIDHAPEHRAHPLEIELQSFSDAIAKGTAGGVSIQDSIPSLRMALTIKGSFEPTQPA